MMKIIVDSVRELDEWRRFDVAPFGSAGTTWSTVVDVTLRAAQYEAHRRQGIASRTRFRKAPYLDLNIELFVSSPGVTDAPDWFTSPIFGLRRLELQRWDISEVDRWVREIVPAGPVSGPDLVHRLRRNFWVDDPSEDEWLDRPHD
jgi:hypothetical protein